MPSFVKQLGDQKSYKHGFATNSYIESTSCTQIHIFHQADVAENQTCHSSSGFSS